MMMLACGRKVMKVGRQDLSPMSWTRSWSFWDWPIYWVHLIPQTLVCRRSSCDRSLWKTSQYQPQCRVWGKYGFSASVNVPAGGSSIGLGCKSTHASTGWMKHVMLLQRHLIFPSMSAGIEQLGVYGWKTCPVGSLPWYTWPEPFLAQAVGPCIIGKHSADARCWSDTSGTRQIP